MLSVVYEIGYGIRIFVWVSVCTPFNLAKNYTVEISQYHFIQFSNSAKFCNFIKKKIVI